jgi:hypothetical protein
VRNATLDSLLDNELGVATRVLDPVCSNLARQLKQDA